MKIEYLSEGSANCPFILIYGDDYREVELLYQAVSKLADGTETAIAIHNLPGFASVDGCEIHAALGKWDAGMMVDTGNVFKWMLRPIAWDNIAGLLEPFCKPRTSSKVTFQYLDDSSGISVIFSTSRAW